MDDTNNLPNDVAECHRLLLAAFKQSLQLEQQAADVAQRAVQAEQRANHSEREVAELTRVLDETAASYHEMQQEHAATSAPNNTIRTPLSGPAFRL